MVVVPLYGLVHVGRLEQVQESYGHCCQAGLPSGNRESSAHPGVIGLGHGHVCTRAACEEKARRLLWHTIAMVRIRRAYGHFSHLENPYGSRAFKEPFMRLALKRADMCCAKVHQCMTNLRGARGGGLLRKESAIWTDSPVMHGHMNSLRRDTQYRPNTLISQPYVPNEFTPNVHTIRCDGSHVHEVVQGQSTKQSENYTMEFAEARCIHVHPIVLTCPCSH